METYDRLDIKVKQSNFRKYRLHIIIPFFLLIAALSLNSIAVLSIMAIVNFLLCLYFRNESAKALIKRYTIIGFFILFGAIPLLFNKLGGESAFFSIGTWGIDLKGVHDFSLVTLRCFAAVGSMMLFTRLTPIYSLCSELRDMNIPKLLIDLVELTYRYIFVLEDITAHIKTAQTSRLGYIGFKNKLNDTGLLIAQTFVLTHYEADHLYNGLVSRGYEDEPGKMIDSEMKKNEEIVSLSNISYAYEKEDEILKGIDIRINKGERIALLGENGAGKSTLLLLLDGVIQHNKGTYKLYGKEMDNSKASMKMIREAIALVFQNSNHQLFTPSVEDEIAYGLRNIGYKDEELDRKVDKIISEYQLDKLRQTPPHKLSEGQKKWVSIAAVLAIDPDLIILDEPTSNLDKYYTHEVLALLDKLHQKGKTIMLSTHDMNLAYQWADKVIVMHKGKILAEGKADEIFRNEDILSQANLEKPLIIEYEASSSHAHEQRI